jgi:mono/diheme cytochrome c family protein
MKLLLSIILVTLIIISCQHRSVPVITERNAAPPVKQNSIYPPVANVAADTIKGKALFQNSCSRCHTLPLVSLYNQKIWDGYLSSMFPRTRLSTENAYHVRAYILANAKQ